MGILKSAQNLNIFLNWLSTESLTKKASLNVLAQAIDFGARVAVELAINPLLVTGLGDFLFGVWRVLWRLNESMLAASGRSTQALKWAIAKRQSSTDNDEKRRYVGSAVVVWLLFSPFLLLLGGLLIWFVPLLLDVPTEYVLITRLTVGLLIVNAMLISLGDMPRAVLQGENLGYKRMGLSAIVILIGGGLTTLAVYYNLGLVGVAAAAVITTFLNGVLFFQIVRTHVSWFGIKKPPFEIVRWFLGLSWWFIVWKFVMQIMLAGDVLILGTFASVELVTTYTLTKYVPEALIRVIAIAALGTAPGLGGIIGAGNLQKAIQVRNEIMSLTWLILTVASTTVLLWNQSFLQLWVGAAYDAGPIATLLIILMMMQFTLIRNDANIIDLTLNIRHKVLLGVFAAILSMGLAAYLVGYVEWGIIGLCWGFIGGRMLLSLIYPGLVGRYLGVSLSAQLKSALRPAITTGLLFVLIFNIRGFLSAGTWLGLVMSSSMTVLLVSVAAFFAGLADNQRRRLLKRGRRVLLSV